MLDKFDRDKFFVNQRRLALREKYYVYDENGQAILYVERPFRFFGRRSITVYEDDSKQTPALFITQDHFWEMWNRNYTVAAPDGSVLARLTRNNIASLFRRGWRIFDPSGAAIAIAREDSIPLAIVRRLLNLVPFVDLLGGLVKTDFHFLRVDAAGNEVKLGSFDRRIGFFDKYVLDLSSDPARSLDRRAALAAGILLDTAERR